MNKYGIHYSGKSSGVIHEKNDDHADIKMVLQHFQAGYTERDIEKVDEFIDELFIKDEYTYAVGTGTEELFLGIEQVKQLIKDDWQYWGDASIDCENVRIDVKDEVAWFATTGSVKYTFEDAIEKYDRHINALKNKVEEKGLTSQQKITYINWFLSLIYHQREDMKREYQWPMRLSGVMLRDAGKWKFVNLKFSMPRSNFPDERFENSKEFMESYNRYNVMAGQYKSNQITDELKTLLKGLETEFVGQKNISVELLKKYFTCDNQPYIIAPEKCWYDGVENIMEFFADYEDFTLSLDLDHAFALKSGGVTSVTAIGILKQQLCGEELAERAIEELNNLFKSDIEPKEKLFIAHRSTAYAIKESANGTSFTCPIRLTALVIEGPTGPVFHNIHFSYPFYWILEGKLDRV